jgi:hypothetical protein
MTIQLNLVIKIPFVPGLELFDPASSMGQAHKLPVINRLVCKQVLVMWLVLFFVFYLKNFKKVRELDKNQSLCGLN